MRLALGILSIPFLAVPQGAPPYPWTNADVGPVGVAGGATYASGRYILDGSGVGVTGGGTADAFHFVHQPVSNDTYSVLLDPALGPFPYSGQIIARVARIQAGDPSSQAGLVIRGGLSANAPSVSYLLTPGGMLTGAVRGIAGDSTIVRAAQAPAPPYWVRLLRSGSRIWLLSSADGVTWTQELYAFDVPDLDGEVLVGLAVAGGASLAQAEFDNVILDGGPDWDGDGLSDAAERSLGYDPAEPDQDGDGIPDGKNDWNGDGLENVQNLVLGAHPGTPPAGPGGGGAGNPPAQPGGGTQDGRCGLLGIEALLATAWLLVRRLRGRSNLR